MTAYWLSAAAVVFSSFAVVTTLSSIVLSLLAPRVARRLERYDAAPRAALLFQIRVLPAVCGSLCAFGVALPVFLQYEPLESDEVIARTLLLAAVAGGALLAGGAWRAGAAWRATAAVRRDWQARGRRLPAFDAPMPVFAIDGAFPTVAVAGFSRPALFIAERVLTECTEDEVRAMVRHECAHVTYRDNLKRFLIRACPDALRRDSAIDRAWRGAVEEAADARAAGGDPRFALALAQALVRVARLAPRASTLEGVSAFYLGGSIESRVRQLIQPADSLPDPSRQLACVVAGTVFVLALAVVAAAPAIHQAMEVAVRLLP